LRDAGGADRLRPGTRLPPVVLLATDGTSVDLAALPGRSLLAVYPWTGRPGRPNPPNWDDIPGAHGSTPELEGFRERASDFAAVGVRVFGLSRQATHDQTELVSRLRLPFPILSDAEGRFAEALGLPAFITGGATYLERLTLLIENGRIEGVFYPIRDPAGHAAELVAWLEQRS
jgi:peroxiredoxin